jgi:hypothetical protein
LLIFEKYVFYFPVETKIEKKQNPPSKKENAQNGVIKNVAGSV